MQTTSPLSLCILFCAVCFRNHRFNHSLFMEITTECVRRKGSQYSVPKFKRTFVCPQPLLCPTLTAMEGIFLLSLSTGVFSRTPCHLLYHPLSFLQPAFSKFWNHFKQLQISLNSKETARERENKTEQAQWSFSSYHYILHIFFSFNFFGGYIYTHCLHFLTSL